MDKFKTPVKNESGKRQIIRLWDNIEKTIRAIRDFGLPKEVKESLDRSLTEMTKAYARADLNSGIVSIPTWMLDFNAYQIQKTEDVPRFLYKPKV